MKSAERKSNIELIRIVAMSIIVIHHFLLHAISPELVPHYDIIMPFFMGGVNLFFMISGYCGIRVSLKSLTGLILTIFIFCIVNLLASGLLGTMVNPRIIVTTVFFPISSSPYWFIQVYLLLMITAPILNAGLEALNQRKLRYILIIFTIVELYSCGIGHNTTNVSGYSYIQALYCYVVAYWYRREENLFTLPKYQYLLLFFGITLLGSVAYTFIQAQSIIAYNSIVTVVGAFALFIWFTKLDFRSKAVNTVASWALGCYLLQDGFFGENQLYPWLHQMYIEHNAIAAVTIFIAIFFLTWFASAIISSASKSVIGAIQKPFEKYPLFNDKL